MGKSKDAPTINWNAPVSLSKKPKGARKQAAEARLEHYKQLIVASLPSAAPNDYGAVGRPTLNKPISAAIARRIRQQSEMVGAAASLLRCETPAGIASIATALLEKPISPSSSMSTSHHGAFTTCPRAPLPPAKMATTRIAQVDQLTAVEQEIKALTQATAGYGGIIKSEESLETSPLSMQLELQRLQLQQLDQIRRMQQLQQLNRLQLEKIESLQDAPPVAPPAAPPTLVLDLQSCGSEELQLQQQLQQLQGLKLKLQSQKQPQPQPAQPPPAPRDPLQQLQQLQLQQQELQLQLQQQEQQLMQQLQSHVTLADAQEPQEWLLSQRRSQQASQQAAAVLLSLPSCQ